MARLPQTEEKSLRILLWLVAVGFFMQTLDATIVNTALPAMARSFGESPLRMQSVVVAYSLAMAMLIPASGWIADRFGTRWVYVSSIALFCPRLHRLCAVAQSDRTCDDSGVAGDGRLAVLRAGPIRCFHPSCFPSQHSVLG